NDQTAELILCDGAGDGGIDLACLLRGDEPVEGQPPEGDTWYIVQSKYGTAFQGEDTLLKEGRKVIETLSGHRNNLSSLSDDLCDRLMRFRNSASERDRLILVFATVDPLSESERRALEDILAMGKSRLGPVFNVEAISVTTIFDQLSERPGGIQVGPVPLRAAVSDSGDGLWVGTVCLEDLYKFLCAYRGETGELDRIYEKNVRRYLGGRRRVNAAIRVTLEEKPERFGLFNNGITIVADNVDAKDGVLNLTTPYIVNGCQTTRTVWDVLSRMLEAGGTGQNTELEAWKLRLCRGSVIAKIVKVGAQDAALLNDITRYTNSQNAVSEKDFVALQDIFQSWASKIAEKHGIYLEIQRGGWDSQKAFQRQNPQTRQFTETANAFTLLKVYGAGWMALPGLAFGKNPPFLPGGAVFHEILNRADGSDQQFSVTDVYAAYRLHSLADEYGFGRGAAKPARGTSRFLFYSVYVELLKQMMAHAAMPIVQAGVTTSMLALLAPKTQPEGKELADAAAALIDEYLTQGAAENSVEKEPSWSGNLNQFLKSEKIGHVGFTPKLRQLIGDYGRVLSRPARGEPAPKDRIVTKLKTCLPTNTP
ncbi:MAG TPA: AIPR family protein, partial [Clostridia bacterium]|nr:AIPR family protein [Clostridia bacterium]